MILFAQQLIKTQFAQLQETDDDKNTGNLVFTLLTSSLHARFHEASVTKT